MIIIFYRAYTVLIGGVGVGLATMVLLMKTRVSCLEMKPRGKLCVLIPAETEHSY